MKKWLIALTIICGAGLLTSAGLAGQIYFKEANVYTDYDKQKLDLTNISSVYINSAIPMTIKPTNGEAYVEFNQSFEDVLGQNPEYKLKVENKDNACYIDLDQVKDTNIWLMIKKDEVMLTVYLPPKALDTLKIQEMGSRRYGYGRTNLDLTGYDIKNLDVDMGYDNISLDGKYENIDINGCRDGNLNIKSKQKANVKIEGSGCYNLDGLFKTVDIDSNNSSIKINTLEAAQVIIENPDGDIKLEGSYSSVKVSGENSSINVKTETLSDIEVANTYENITLSGPLKAIKVNGEFSNIDIQTTTNTKSIEVKGEQNDTTLRMPSNIPGFKITSVDGEYYDSEHEMDDNYDYEYNELPKINSDFKLEEKDKNTYTYGDSSTKMMVAISNSFRIVDGGYTSAK